MEKQSRAGGADALDDSDNDDQQLEEAPTHTFDDDSEDDAADPQQVLSFVGAAQAPSGYKILESCPSLETEKNMQNFIGTVEGRPQGPPRPSLGGNGLVSRSFMPGTARTGRDGSREGCAQWVQPQRARSCACSHSPFFCAIQKVVDSWRQEEENCSTL